MSGEESFSGHQCSICCRPGDPGDVVLRSKAGGWKWWGERAEGLVPDQLGHYKVIPRC